MKSPGQQITLSHNQCKANDKKVYVFEGADPDKQKGGVGIDQCRMTTIWLSKPKALIMAVHPESALSLRHVERKFRESTLFKIN